MGVLLTLRATIPPFALKSAHSSRKLPPQTYWFGLIDVALGGNGTIFALPVATFEIILLPFWLLFPRDAQRVCPVKSNGHKTRPCLSLTCAWRQQSRSSATADDAVHGAFMTLAPYTRTREGEVPAASSLPTFAHRDRLARRIKGERASMREGQVTSLEQARCRAVFRDVRQPGSRLLASAHVCGQNLTFQGLDHLLLRVFFGATQQKRTSRSEIS